MYMLTNQPKVDIMPFERKGVSMQNLHKRFLIWNIVLLVLAMACLFYYDYEGGLWLKGVTSGWFVLLGAVNVAYGKKLGGKDLRFLLLAELALFLSMAADVLLGVQFLVGTAVFALGHVCYFAAFCALEKFRRRDLLVTAPIGVVSLILVLATPFIRVEDPVMQAMLVVYALVISFMLGKAVGNLLVKRSLSRWLLAVGAAMFWFSDLMLALNLFGSGGRLASTLCMYTYWPGQILLAHALFHAAEEE